MATSKLTRVLKDGFSNIRTSTFSLSRELQPRAFMAMAAEMSALMPSGVRAEMERKSLPCKIDLLYATSIS
jgi:hypothetical protein